MKLTRKKIWFAAVCLLLISITVTAEMQTTTTEDASKMMDKSHEHEHAAMMKTECRIDGRADTLQSIDHAIGMAVTNHKGQMLGTIDDVILNRNDQVVQYVILSSADELHPVPWKALDSGTDTYTLDISMNDLSRAPMISSINMRMLSSPDFQMKSHDYYATQIKAMQAKHKTQPSAEALTEYTEEKMTEKMKTDLMASNKLIGLDVNDMQNKKLGDLSDIVFDVRQGNLAYALITFGGVSGFSEKTAAAPWDSLKLDADQNDAMINADKSSLQASILPAGNLKMLCEPTFARQVHQGFNQEPYWEVFGFIEPSATPSEASTGMRMEQVQNIEGPAWETDSPYCKSFNPDSVEKMSGTVIKTGMFSACPESSPGLRLRVKTDQGRIVNVYAGPRQHYFKQQMRFKKGDQISLTGSEAMVNNKTVIMACQIDKGTDSFKVRDMKGTPTWSAK